jgi:hypothetical protein
MLYLSPIALLSPVHKCYICLPLIYCLLFTTASFLSYCSSASCSQMFHWSTLIYCLLFTNVSLVSYCSSASCSQMFHWSTLIYCLLFTNAIFVSHCSIVSCLTNVLFVSQLLQVPDVSLSLPCTVVSPSLVGLISFSSLISLECNWRDYTNNSHPEQGLK